jgi:hypothetical protein
MINELLCQNKCTTKTVLPRKLVTPPLHVSGGQYVTLTAWNILEIPSRILTSPLRSPLPCQTSLSEMEYQVILSCACKITNIKDRPLIFQPWPLWPLQNSPITIRIVPLFSKATGTILLNLIHGRLGRLLKGLCQYFLISYSVYSMVFSLGLVPSQSREWWRNQMHLSKPSLAPTGGAGREAGKVTGRASSVNFMGAFE